METIIFATGNQNKLKEIREIVRELPYEIRSLKEMGIDLPIEENGTTFEENACIKVKTIMDATGCMVMADDSGLEVDYMGKEPGMHSARFLGEDTSYDIKNRYILDQLKEAHGEERSARFICAIAFGQPGKEILTTRGVMEGRIHTEIAGKNGFGYDPIFFLPEYGKTSAELSPEQKNAISHRGKALRQMQEILIGLAGKE